MRKSKTISVRIDGELKKKSEALATKEGRSLASLIRHLLVCAIADLKRT